MPHGQPATVRGLCQVPEHLAAICNSTDSDPQACQWDFGQCPYIKFVSMLPALPGWYAPIVASSK